MNYRCRNIILGPHCDDIALFASYTVIKYKPLAIVWENKECTQERKKEEVEALNILGINVVFIHELWELSEYVDAEKIFAPSPRCLHKDHQLMSEAAKELWGDKVIYYSTYIKPGQLQPFGSIKVENTDLMRELKLKALKCFNSQIKATPKHFNLKDKSEYYD